MSPETRLWSLGEPTLDARLPGGGLDPAATIEIKPATHADWATVLAFAACLAVRRLGSLASAASASPVLWCTTRAATSEHGRLNGAGLTSLGLPPEAILLVETARRKEALWTLEEALRSGALALAVGILDSVDLTPSRRLSLSAAAGRTPLLLMTRPDTPPALSSAVRMRLSRRPSAPHPFDARAPGIPRFGLTLERCRGAPVSDEAVSLDLEWCHVTHRFSLAAGLVDRTHATGGARHRAGG